MTLVSCHSLTHGYGPKLLFKEISFGIFQEDSRIGFIGPNGAGKSTLLKILGKIEKPDSGEVVWRKGLKVAYLSQKTEFPPLSLRETLLAHSESPGNPDTIRAAETLLSKFGFLEFDRHTSTLSGGWKKRLGLAALLMQNPDLLLLDEPTNHLDLEGVLWLEKFLNQTSIPYVLISHDRAFLQNTTNKMMELNPIFPKGIFIQEGSFQQFLTKREEFLSGLKNYEEALESKVRVEKEWLKHSPKARTTKAQSRIDQGEELIRELEAIERRDSQSLPLLAFSSSERKTEKLLSLKNISKIYEGREIFSGVDLLITPKTRLGVLGGNGAGKTSFLKILAGLLEHDTGTLKRAEDLSLVYFDQEKETLDESEPLRRVLSPHSDRIDYGKKTIHVNQWCKKFNFPTHFLDLPVGRLSGGEKARLLIARLILKEADILLLDEPTNDLDLSTLEILEDSLKNFPGAVVIISHDRALLDKVCNQILVLDLAPPQFFEDLSQWQQSVQSKTPPSPKPLPKANPSSKEKTKMSFKEKMELEKMDKIIEDLENEITSIEKS